MNKSIFEPERTPDRMPTTTMNVTPPGRLDLRDSTTPTPMPTPSSSSPPLATSTPSTLSDSTHAPTTQRPGTAPPPELVSEPSSSSRTPSRPRATTPSILMTTPTAAPPVTEAPFLRRAAYSTSCIASSASANSSFRAKKSSFGASLQPTMDFDTLRKSLGAVTKTGALSERGSCEKRVAGD